jgi:hypothetical protein
VLLVSIASAAKKIGAAALHIDCGIVILVPACAHSAVQFQEHHMKEGAYILKYKGKELRTPADVSAVQEALFNDLAAGNVTPAEARKIQKEIRPILKRFKSMLKTLDQAAKFHKLMKKNKETNSP